MTSKESRRTEKEQLLLKLESILDLYKNFQDGAEEEDKLIILDALGDIRQILNEHNITRPLGRTEVTEIESVLKGLKSHVKAMALDDLFDQVKDLKWRMDVTEKRWDLENSLRHPKIYLYDGDDDEIWSRISAKRKEILGKSSLWLSSRPPRNVYKARFALGSSLPVRAGTAEENEVENTDEIPEDERNRYTTCSTDQLLQNRINHLQSILKERKTRLRAARRRSKISSGLIASADFTFQNSRECLRKARGARYGEIGDTIHKIQDSAPKEKTTQGESGTHCDECHRIMKERDKFWGLESDSEEEEFKDFNDLLRRRSMIRNPRTTLEKKICNSSSSRGYKAVASRYKPRRIAGRGTWATPAYVPPWEAKEFERKRGGSKQTVSTEGELDEARFGPKKGILKKLFNRLTGHHV